MKVKKKNKQTNKILPPSEVEFGEKKVVLQDETKSH